MKLFRYVTNDRIPDYIRLGWIAHPSLEGTHHGTYGVLCQWLCACRLVEPVKDE